MKRSTLKRGKGFAASYSQQSKVAEMACAVCRRGSEEVRIDPAHLCPRSMGGCDAPECVVPLCRSCHRMYDDGVLDILPALEPHYRDELAHALGHLGLVGLYRRVTNERKAA